jgi:hypothetical protein
VLILHKRNASLSRFRRYHPNEWKQAVCREKMSKEHQRRGSDAKSKLIVYDQVEQNFTPAFKYIFFEKYKDPNEW